MAYLKAQRFDFDHHITKTLNVLIQAVRVAESYYSCENIEGVALENEGTSNVATYVLLCCLSTMLMHLMLYAYCM